MPERIITVRIQGTNEVGPAFQAVRAELAALEEQAAKTTITPGAALGGAGGATAAASREVTAALGDESNATQMLLRLRAQGVASIEEMRAALRQLGFTSREIAAAERDAAGQYASGAAQQTTATVASAAYTAALNSQAVSTEDLAASQVALALAQKAAADATRTAVAADLELARATTLAGEAQETLAAGAVGDADALRAVTEAEMRLATATAESTAATEAAVAARAHLAEVRALTPVERAVSLENAPSEAGLAAAQTEAAARERVAEAARIQAAEIDAVASKTARATAAAGANTVETTGAAKAQTELTAALSTAGGASAAAANASVALATARAAVSATTKAALAADVELAAASKAAAEAQAELAAATSAKAGAAAGDVRATLGEMEAASAGSAAATRLADAQLAAAAASRASATAQAELAAIQRAATVVTNSAVAETNAFRLSNYQVISAVEGTRYGILSVAGALTQGFLPALIGVGVAFGAFRALEGITGNVYKLGMATRQLSEETGATSEQAGGMLAVFERFDVQVGTAETRLAMFARRLQGFEDSTSGFAAGNKRLNQTLEDLGVQITNADGSARDMHALLLDVADVIHTMPEGFERTALATQLFGRGAEAMIVPLALGSQKFLELEAAAKRFGITVSGENMAAVTDFIAAQKDLDQASQGLSITLGTTLSPALAGLERGLATALSGTDEQRLSQMRLREVLGQNTAAQSAALAALEATTAATEAGTKAWDDYRAAAERARFARSVDVRMGDVSTMEDTGRQQASINAVSMALHNADIDMQDFRRQTPGLVSAFESIPKPAAGAAEALILLGDAMVKPIDFVKQFTAEAKLLEQQLDFISGKSKSGADFLQQARDTTALISPPDVENEFRRRRGGFPQDEVSRMAAQGQAQANELARIAAQNALATAAPGIRSQGDQIATTRALTAAQDALRASQTQTATDRARGDATAARADEAETARLTDQLATMQLVDQAQQQINQSVLTKEGLLIRAGQEEAANNTAAAAGLRAEAGLWDDVIAKYTAARDGIAAVTDAQKALASQRAEEAFAQGQQVQQTNLSTQVVAQQERTLAATQEQLGIQRQVHALDLQRQDAQARGDTAQVKRLDDQIARENAHAKYLQERQANQAQVFQVDQEIANAEIEQAREARAGHDAEAAAIQKKIDALKEYERQVREAGKAITEEQTRATATGGGSVVTLGSLAGVGRTLDPYRIYGPGSGPVVPTNLGGSGPVEQAPQGMHWGPTGWTTGTAPADIGKGPGQGTAGTSGDFIYNQTINGDVDRPTAQEIIDAVMHIHRQAALNNASTPASLVPA